MGINIVNTPCTGDKTNKKNPGYGKEKWFFKAILIRGNDFG